MSQKKLSAKDKAFEQERIKYRREINILTKTINAQELTLKELNERVVEMSSKIDEQNDWIRRLLEYCDLDEDFMRNKISKEKEEQKKSSELEDIFSGVKSFMGLKWRI